MSRELHVTPEVAELLGVEQLARIQGPDWPARVQCWRCGVWAEAVEDLAVSVLRVIDPAAQPGVGTVSVAVQTHPACLTSMVLEITPAQLAHIQAARPPAEPGQDVDEADLDLLATIAGTAEQPYPLLLLSYRSDVTVERPAGDRVDLLTSTYLEAGWHPITTLAVPPGPAPAGHRVLFHHDLPDDDALGVLAVVGPNGVDTTAAVTPLELWRPLVRAYGWTAVVHGTHYLADGPEGLDRAVRSGLLVGGRVPVTLDGPGNAEEVRS